MCNLGMAVELKGVNRGIAQGREQSLLESIRNLMDSMKWTAQQAMDALKVPKDDQAHYAAMLGSTN